ncbi:MAG: hypothetical protein KAH93_05140, partial [Candidatus Aenigmarchaeota archaeon]|nr:hypothetical protein [Candidatus Aenigmarchaeota archaeon]
KSAFVESPAGVYSFNVTSLVNYYYTHVDTSNPTIGDATYPGLHTISVSVTRDESGKVYSGVDTDDYNQTVPRPDYTPSGTDGTIYNGHAEDIIITIKNSGVTTLHNITATPEVYLGTTHKTIISPTICNWAIPNSLAPGATHDCAFTVTPTTDGAYEIDLTVTGKDSAGRTYTYSKNAMDTFDVSTLHTTPAETNTPASTDTPASTETNYPDCNVDDDCFGDEYCNIHLICKELYCADDEVIQDHACVKNDVEDAVAQIADYSLSITGPDDLEFEHGAFRNVTFNLKNTGEKNVTGFRFLLEFADESIDADGWYKVLSNYSDTLESGAYVSVKVEINTVNLSIGAHEVVALGESSEANANLSFTLNVIPDDDEKAVINSTMSKLDLDYSQMYDQLAVLLHDYANNTNLTALNDTLSEVGEHLKNAKAAIERGDYLSAYESQVSAESLMVEVKSKLEEQESIAAGEMKSNWLRNSLIVVVLLIAGMFGWQYYNSMNLHSGTLGYQHGKGFKLKKKKKRTLNDSVMKEVSMLSGMIKSNKSKSKTSPFSYGYGSYGSKGIMSCARKKEGVFDRFRGVFRKNKRDVTQKTLYDISSVYTKKKSKKLKVRCL